MLGRLVSTSHEAGGRGSPFCLGGRFVGPNMGGGDFRPRREDRHPCRTSGRVGVADIRPVSVSDGQERVGLGRSFGPSSQHRYQRRAVASQAALDLRLQRRLSAADPTFGVPRCSIAHARDAS